MIRSGVCLTVLLLLFAISTVIASGVPQTIQYQGRITDDAGNPVPDGGFWIIFSIYDVPEGGTPLWRSDSVSYLIFDGLLNHPLGATEPLPDDLFTDTSLWLSIKVDADPEMTPRRRLTSAPFAYQALRADTAGYALAVAGGEESHWHVTDSVLYSNAFLGIARGASGNTLHGNATHTHVNLGSQSTTGSSGYNSTGATISGGVANVADSHYTTVGGGWHNGAHDRYCTVSGGEYNDARGVCTSVGGGYSDSADGNFSVISGGRVNSVTGESSTIGGGRYNRITVDHGTIAGGDSNTVTGNWGTVGGGQNSTAHGEHSTVSGGKDNEAEGQYGTIAGGNGSFAVERGSTVGGGQSNTASGYYATIPGGSNNIASGGYSFAAGHTAHALHDNSFVWSGVSGGASFGSTDTGQFLIDAPGGVGILNATPLGALDIAQNSDEVCLHFSNGTKDITWGRTHALQIGQWDGETWTERMRISRYGEVGIGREDPSYLLDCDGIIRCEGVNETSDARLKKNIGTIDNALDRVESIRGVSFEWIDQTEDKSGRQIGVIAQEIEPVFPELVSADNKGIKSVDYTKLTAVLIEAVKELKAKNEALTQRVETLENQ